MLVRPSMQLHGLGALNAAALRWSAILQQAVHDHSMQWGAKDSFDPLSGGYTVIDGLWAQIYITAMTGAYDGRGELRPGFEGDGALFGLPGNNVLFNLRDPDYVGADGQTDWMLQLSRGPNDTVIVRPYKMKDGFLRDMVAFVAAAFGMYYAVGALGAVSAGGGTAGVAAGGSTVGATAAELTAADLAMIDAGAGLMPEFGSIAAYEAGIAGATAGAVASELTAADLMAIDAGGGLLPEYGSFAAYEAGIGGGISSGSNWLSTARNTLSTVKTATGAASMLTAITGGGASAPRTVSTRTSTPYASNYNTVPQVTTQYTHAKPADNNMMWLGLGAAVLGVLFISRG